MKQNDNLNGERKMSLPKYNQVADETIKSLINLSDLVKSGMNLKVVKIQAEIKGFSLIAKARSFKQVLKAIQNELNQNGLIIV
jgi:hypothetical protein